MTDKNTGTCKWFNSSKGYGFITPSDGSADVFVHQGAIYADGFRSLAEGEEVEYKVETDEGGRQKAVDVTGPHGEYVKGDNRRGGGYSGGGGGGYDDYSGGGGDYGTSKSA
eukprot:Platyproteum_vivax@DN5677_c1_g1_i3.p1